MTCKCGSNRILILDAKSSDMNCMQLPHLNVEHEGYVISGLGVGAGDYIRISLCLECGKVQENNRVQFPITDDKIKEILIEEGILEPEEENE